jgi:hypothetical protein
MPAPRALLRDIAAQGLDPNVEYFSVGKDGHIRDHRNDSEHQVISHKPVPPPVVTSISKSSVPEVKVEVKIETKDGIEEEKVDVTVGDVKLEVEVPIASSDDKKEVELPDIPEGTQEIVLASSKKNKAKKSIEKKEDAVKQTEIKKADEKPVS